MVVLVKLETLEEKKERVAHDVVYKFRDTDEFTKEQLADPDYRLKQLAKQQGLDPSSMLVCTKCHHCR